MKAPQLLLLVLLGFLVICSLTTAWYFSTAACLSDDADELVDPHNDIIRSQHDVIKELKAQTTALKRQNDDCHAQLRSEAQVSSPVATTSDIATKEEAAIHRMDQLLPSSVWCVGSNQTTRVCQFNNLYFNRSKNRFFIAVGATSVFDNAPEDPSNTVIELTSLEGHSAFFFSYDEVPLDMFQSSLEVNVIYTKTFIFARFHPYNIMHVLHDDLFNLYHHLVRYASLGTGLAPEAVFSLDHQFQMYDLHEESAYFKLLKFFTNKPIRFRRHLQSHEVTCFRAATVGQSKQTSWYQYGFGTTQGPIPSKTVFGGHVRAAVNYLMRSINVEPHESLEHINTQEAPWIVLFTRSRNRLLLNQEALLSRLREDYPQYPVKVVSMEEHSFEEQVSILRRTRLAIGLHGSILIMGAFLPPGAVLIELYPFAVPPDNYTPYRTMANLPGMHFTYRYWVNTHEENNVMHPEWSRLAGGINHLSVEERQKILDTKTVPTHVCCEDPYWLFRIYQDTTVHLDEVSQIVREAIAESDHKPIIPVVRALGPATIGGVSCKDETSTSVTLVWEGPWNHAKVLSYGIWHHQSFRTVFVKAANDGEDAPTTFTFTDIASNTAHDFWVRIEQPGFTGSYSDKTTCRTLP